jgi:hypothetical protein
MRDRIARSVLCLICRDFGNFPRQIVDAASHHRDFHTTPTVITPPRSPARARRSPARTGGVFARDTVSHAMTDPPECLACGACCFSRAERYVRVRGDDHARLGDAAEGWVRWFANEAYMRMDDGHCAALRVDGDHFVCAIYADRPQTFRDLARGSPSCDADRWRKRSLSVVR